MTALAHQTASRINPQGSSLRGPGDGVDWSRWIEADKAARLLGDIHPRSLRRQCKDTLKRSGEAMHCAGPEGGNAKWWIRRSYDLRLSSAPAPGCPGGSAQPMPDLGVFSEKQIDQAMQRAACVRRLWSVRAAETRAQKAWLPALIKELRGEHPGLKISRSTLFVWHGAYRDPADLVKLIDTRGGNTRGEPDPLCWELFRGLYLTEQKRSGKWCWKQVRAKAKADGLSWCSYPQCIRLIRKRISPAEYCKHRDPERYRSRHSDYIDMDPDTWGAGETWIGDHSVLDMWCVSGGGKLIRPWLTAWMDWKTRKIVGWLLCESPNSATILSAFSRAMLDPSNNGGPDTVYIDNGRDYAAETFAGKTKAQFRKESRSAATDIDEPAFRGLYAVLDIEIIFATPYNARAKGRIEQWFNYSLHQDFDKSFASYAGNKPTHRPECLAEILKDGSMVPTFAEVRARLENHIAGYNASHDHGKQDLDGMSPVEAMALGRMRMFADPGVLDRFMLTYSKPVRVRRHRVTVPILGKGHVYKSDDPNFAALNGRSDEYRVGYDQDDLRGAVLFDERMRPVCRLYEATYGRATQGGDASGAVSRSDLSEALSRQRRLNRAKKLQAEAGLDQVLSTQELAMIESGKRSTPRKPTGGEPNALPTRLVQTPVDGQLNELRRLDMKQAAGGEVSRGMPDVTDFFRGSGGGGLDDDDAPTDPLAFVGSPRAHDQEGYGDDDPLSFFGDREGGGL